MLPREKKEDPSFVHKKQAPPTLMAINCKGVWWLELTSSGSAPNLNSFITIEKSPLRAAMCSALHTTMIKTEANRIIRDLTADSTAHLLPNLLLEKKLISASVLLKGT